MSRDEKIDSIIQQIADLPAELEAEFFQSILEMRSQHLGIYNPEQELA